MDAPVFPRTPVPAARLLETALLFNFIIHALAMLAMIALLMRCLPGGGTVDDALRVRYIAGHPWLFRLGWFPWQVTAASDVLLGVALLYTPWIPRLPALLTLLVTLVAVVPDQTGQLLWMTHGVHLAKEATASGDLTPYLQFEAPTFKAVAGFGALGYLVGALGWTWCFVLAGVWSRRLTWLSFATWGVFAVAVALFFLPQRWKPNPLLIGAANAAGFCLLQVWLVAVTDRVAARSRPALRPWRPPGQSVFGSISAWLANSGFARLLGERVPSMALVSEIRDAIYVNYLVDADHLAALVPTPLELQRLGPDGRWAMFTILMYRHGHFGPRLLGPLRKLLPSPMQSNWRTYVIDPHTGLRGVFFVTTAIARIAHALTARLLCEGVPMHVPARMQLDRDDAGDFRLFIDPADGSAPDLKATLRPTDCGALPAPWSDCFKDYADLLAYTVPQNRALAPQPWYGRTARQEIDLGIPLSSVRPMQGDVSSAAASAIVGDAQPLSFLVPEVAFLFAGERFDG